MCAQPKPWTHRSSSSAAAQGDTFAADQAWFAKCLADRRRAQAETGTLHTHNASLRSFESAAV